MRGSGSSDDENDNNDYCYEDQDTDEDSVDYLAERFDEFNIAHGDSKDDLSIELGGLSSGHQSD